jgi:hypothetical protein
MALVRIALFMLLAAALFAGAVLAAGLLGGFATR